MNYNLAIVIGLGFHIALGNTPAPFAANRLLLDRIVTSAKSPVQVILVLDVLERVALGHNNTISDDSSEQLGVQGRLLRQKSFGEPEVRAHALRKIGELGTLQALQFLGALRLADVQADSVRQVWPAAQIALRHAGLAQITDRQMRIDFLSNILTEPHDPISNSAVVSWAVDELCNRGALSALPEIRPSIRSRVLGEDAEEEIRFCEGRISVWYRNIDHARALGSVLNVETSAQDYRLTEWALHQLSQIRSPNAEAELRRFTKEIGQVPPASPNREILVQYKDEIETILMELGRPN
jgi:hypothetical protein